MKGGEKDRRGTEIAKAQAGSGEDAKRNLHEGSQRMKGRLVQGKGQKGNSVD